LIVSDQLFQFLVSQQTTPKNTKSGKNLTSLLPQNTKLVDDQFIQSSMFKSISNLFGFSELSSTINKTDLEFIFKNGLADPVITSFLDNSNLNAQQATVSKEFEQIQNKFIKILISKLSKDIKLLFEENIVEDNSLLNNKEFSNIKNNLINKEFSNIKNNLINKDLLNDKVLSNNKEFLNKNLILSPKSDVLEIKLLKLVDENLPKILKEAVEISVNLLNKNYIYAGRSITGDIFINELDKQPKFVSKPVMIVLEKLIFKQPINSETINFISNLKAYNTSNLSQHKLINLTSNSAVTFPKIDTVISSIINLISNNPEVSEKLSKDSLVSFLSLIKDKNIKNQVISKFSNRAKNIINSALKNFKNNNKLSLQLRLIADRYDSKIENETINKGLNDSTKASKFIKEANLDELSKHINKVSKDMVVFNNFDNKELVFPFIFGDISGQFVQENKYQNSEYLEDSKFFSLELETTNLGSIKVSFDVDSKIGINFTSENAKTRMILRKEKRELFDKLKDVIDMPVTIGIH